MARLKTQGRMTYQTEGVDFFMQDSQNGNMLKEKYGLLTAVCMVVGTVIGSGIFFRNEAILAAIGGRMWVGVLAWGIGGFITLTSAYVFAILAARYKKVGGLVDYSEILVSKRYGYMFGWFLSAVFYPSLAGILAWISGRFTVILFGWEVNPNFSAQTYLFALIYLLGIFAINTLSPKLSGYFQVTTTFLKVVPLIAMGIIGTIVGLSNGTALANINTSYIPQAAGNPFLIALVATAFAYLGWDAIININAEIKDSKRNLPIALVGGMLIIITIYIAYFVGVFSAAPIALLVGGEGVLKAFVNVFSSAAGTILFVFIIISCIGTLNGLVIGAGRSFYVLAVRGNGPKPTVLSQVDTATNAPHNSAVLSLLFIGMWMMVYGANFAGWYGGFFFDIPGLVPITFQGFLIPLYIFIVAKEKDLGVFNRFVAPVTALLGSFFLIFAVIYNQGSAVLWYLIVFTAVMCIGLFWFRKS